MARLIALFISVLLPTLAWGGSVQTSAGAVVIERMAAGLDEPWSIGFLPDGSVLITERDGALKRLSPSGAINDVSGGPQVVALGQGGLLDVMVPEDFARSREVFLTYAKAQPGGAGTAIGVGRLSVDGKRLESFRDIFETLPGSSGGRHFGGRLAEARDGTLFLTVGDRGDGPEAQNRANHQGSVLRLTRAGQPAPGNPYIGQTGVAPEIWSHGHRNPQGAALDASGQLWVHEHGARGGDEVNRIEKGANYGWPVISYGRHYSGAKIGEGTRKPGLQQPVHYWDPSIAPSGMLIYSGKLWPRWRGQIFVGSLKFDHIARLGGTPLTDLERIEGPETGRVRDVREAPDGSIWFLSVLDGAAYRMSPSP